MNTNFFQTIDGLNVIGDWKITLSKAEKDKWAVSILLVNEKLEDDAKKVVPPMILKGTAKELDEGFFKAIETPVKKTSELFANMENYLASLEEAEKKSKMEKEKEDKEKKGIEERKKKYESKMKNVADLEEKEK
jgi:PRTRC genetic system protein E